MHKYELTRKLFHELLHYSFEEFTITFSDNLKCLVKPAQPVINPEKNYLGIIPLTLEIIERDKVISTVNLKAEFKQSHLIPSLEDGEGGYAFLIRGKSELVYRAMQAALYNFTEHTKQATLSTDLDSKKGDKNFLLQMKKWLSQYEHIWKPWNSQLLPSDQFLFLTYNSETSEIIQAKQHVLNSAVFIAILKAVYKKEIMLPLSLQNPIQSAKKPSVWKIAPGEKASFWEEALKSHEIFVGWNKLGDLQQYDTREDLMESYKSIYSPEQEPVRDVFTLWSFYQRLKPGDIVIANKGWRQLVGIGRVSGDYLHKNDEDRFPNRRKVDWIITEEVKFDENIFSTPTLTPVHNDKLMKIQKEVIKQVNEGEQKWKELFGEIIFEEESFIDDFNRFLRSRQFSFSKEFITQFVTSLQSKPFVILSGMSGTGKTKIAQLFADYMNKNNSATPTGSGKKELTISDTKLFRITVQPYYHRYSRMIIPKQIMEWIDLEDLHRGHEIDLQYEGNVDKGLLKQAKRGHVELLFRKNFFGWFKAHFQIGDQLALTIHDEGRKITFGTPTTYTKNQAEENLAFLSVRPDWLDHHGLLGSYNPLTQTYQATPLLKIMLKAIENPDRPYFAILDEMNLAKVEYYFSDFLSCMESRRRNENGDIVQEGIHLHNQSEEELFVADEEDRIYKIPQRIELPLNLYIIGTVNIDETTYMFSPKVLDRANVIEFNDVDFSQYVNMSSEEAKYIWPYTWEEKINWFTTEGEFHESLYRKEFLENEWKTELEPAFHEIVALHQIMQEEGYSFGYRVVDEIMNYILLTRWFDYCSIETALDAQITQKILPKLHGNRKQMESLLLKIIRFTIGEHLQTDVLTEEEKDVLEYEEFYQYPLSGRKAYKMYKQLLKTGYCSFIS